METYSTPVLDLTKIVTGIELVPARPGYIATQLNREWIIVQFAGTQTSPTTYQAGSDAAHQNYAAPSPTPTNAVVNAIVNTPAIGNGGGIVTGGQRFPNATIFLDITVAAQGTGGFTLLARYVTNVWWIAVGGGL